MWELYEWVSFDCGVVVLWCVVCVLLLVCVMREFCCFAAAKQNFIFFNGNFLFFLPKKYVNFRFFWKTRKCKPNKTNQQVKVQRKERSGQASTTNSRCSILSKNQSVLLVYNLCEEFPSGIFWLALCRPSSLETEAAYPCVPKWFDASPFTIQFKLCQIKNNISFLL